MDVTRPSDTLQEAFTLSYDLSIKDYGPSVRNVEMRWANQELDQIIDNLNAFFRAAELPVVASQRAMRR